jgi:hypothetical protein
MELLEARAVARRLRVSERRVRALAQSGRLRAQKVAGRWFVDPGAAARRLVTRDARGGRPVKVGNAWAELFLASGEQPAWLSDSAARRVRRRLLERPLRERLPRLERRADVRYFLGGPAALDEVRRHSQFVASGVSAADHYGADIVAPSVVEGYLPKEEVDRLTYLFALREVEELRANLILHAAEYWPFDGRRIAPRAVVAADLLLSMSERTRRAGERLLRA